MVDKQDKASSVNRADDQGQPANKTQARRERQAQALRRNLARRKAQKRDRASDHDPQSAAITTTDRPSRN